MSAPQPHPAFIFNTGLEQCKLRKWIDNEGNVIVLFVNPNINPHVEDSPPNELPSPHASSGAPRRPSSPDNPPSDEGPYHGRHTPPASSNRNRPSSSESDTPYSHESLYYRHCTPPASSDRNPGPHLASEPDLPGQGDLDYANAVPAYGQRQPVTPRLPAPGYEDHALTGISQRQPPPPPAQSISQPVDEPLSRHSRNLPRTGNEYRHSIVGLGVAASEHPDTTFNPPRVRDTSHVFGYPAYRAPAAIHNEVEPRYHQEPTLSNYILNFAGRHQSQSPPPIDPARRPVPQLPTPIPVPQLPTPMPVRQARTSTVQPARRVEQSSQRLRTPEPLSPISTNGVRGLPVVEPASPRVFSNHYPSVLHPNGPPSGSSTSRSAPARHGEHHSDVPQATEPLTGSGALLAELGQASYYPQITPSGSRSPHTDQYDGTSDSSRSSSRSSFMGSSEPLLTPGPTADPWERTPRIGPVPLPPDDDEFMADSVPWMLRMPPDETQ